MRPQIVATMPARKCRHPGLSKDSGELTGMTIIATFGQVTCGEVNTKRAPGKDFTSVKTYELHYTFDGKQFTIAPESKAALKAFPQQDDL
jgi:hypothetical protein